VCVNDLHFVVHPQDEELVQTGRNTLIDMDPIAPKN
jgi:hypothetical protein